MILFPLVDVKEVMLVCAFQKTEVPSGALEGFLSVEGRNLPVLRLSDLLGGAAVPLGLYGKLIRLEGKGLEFLVRVEEVPGVLEVEASARISQKESFSYQGCIQAVLSLGEGQEAPVLDPEKLLREAEVGWIRDWERRFQDRLIPCDAQTGGGTA